MCGMCLTLSINSHSLRYWFLCLAEHQGTDINDHSVYSNTYTGSDMSYHLLSTFMLQV